MARQVQEPPWYELHVPVPEPLRDIVLAHLATAGTSGCQELDEEIVAYFRTDLPPRAVARLLRRELARLGHLLPPGALRIRRVRATDWVKTWQASLSPVQVSPRILICPSWQAVPAPAEGIVLVLDPGMAFGSGHHATTRGVLLLLEEFIPERRRVLDLGTGSGILAIAAAKLGASQVWACDIDPQAVLVARDNLRANGVAGRVRLWAGSIDACRGQDCDLLMANITAQALTPLLPALRRVLAPAGVLLLSGIIDREESSLVQALQQSGLRVARRLQIEEWISFAATGNA
ncbi:MAG: 50S ribosomal protein L11 methyltransferase [bacterium]|jgi:ribosomal protein L11 methyltransferase|nr:50S ribosomal protein L11 methyltransferase [candidate division KSB1 bacterium]MDH7561404.1 50S ribosomal protein L11 methyltransferase [bacterium]